MRCTVYVHHNSHRFPVPPLEDFNLNSRTKSLPWQSISPRLLTWSTTLNSSSHSSYLSSTYSFPHTPTPANSCRWFHGLLFQIQDFSNGWSPQHPCIKCWGVGELTGISIIRSKIHHHSFYSSIQSISCNREQLTSSSIKSTPFTGSYFWHPLQLLPPRSI